MSAKKNYAALDLAKYAGAMLVVAIHTFPFEDISPAFNLYFISTICRLAVPFFFVCSSFFLFGKERKAASVLEKRRVLLSYLKRLGILYLIWTVIYLPYTIWNYSEAGFTFLSLLGWIRDFLLNGSYYHLWFLPALMLGVCLVWYWNEKKGLVHALKISLILYVIGYVINIFGPFWQTVPGVSIVYGFFTKTLVTARDGIFFAPIYVCLGLMASRLRKPSRNACAVGFGISFLCLILEVTLYARIGMLNDLSSMFLMLIPCMYFLMNLLLQVRMPWKPLYKELRQDSTLIYVSHILFARILLMLLPNNHLVAYLATLACAQLLSYVIVKESRRWPWLNYLM